MSLHVLCNMNHILLRLQFAVTVKKQNKTKVLTFDEVQITQQVLKRLALRPKSHHTAYIVRTILKWCPNV